MERSVIEICAVITIIVLYEMELNAGDVITMS